MSAEELKAVCDALSGLGDQAQAGFIVWCIKEVVVYTIPFIGWAVLFVILGRVIPRALLATVSCWSKPYCTLIRLRDLLFSTITGPLDGSDCEKILGAVVDLHSAGTATKKQVER